MRCAIWGRRSEQFDRDDNGNITYARFVQRAIMPDGRFSDGWGACDHREKRFAKPNHDVSLRVSDGLGEGVGCPGI